jgi:hypothetical protein
VRPFFGTCDFAVSDRKTHAIKFTRLLMTNPSVVSWELEKIAVALAQTRNPRRARSRLKKGSVSKVRKKRLFSRDTEEAMLGAGL